jgi:tetratricopeptide (TPR) repeat protein
LLVSGDAARDRRDWRRAIACYEAFLELRPERWPIRVQLGHAYKEAGDITAAEKAYRTAADVAPADADVFLQLARAYVAGRKLQAARAAYERSLELDPEGPALFELESFNREHPSEPSDDEGGGVRSPWRSLGDARAARDARTWSAAVPHYQAYLERERRSADVWEELAYVLERAERHHEALEAVRRALALKPGTLSAVSLEAGILRSLGRMEDSAEVWMEVWRRTGSAGPTDDYGQPLTPS